MTSASRRERRQAGFVERRDARRARHAPKSASPLRSPMALFTIGALVLGLVIVVVVFLQQPATSAVSLELTSPGARIPPGLSDGRTLGQAAAPVTVEIWSDFQCPACRTLATDVEPAIIEAYVVSGTAKLVYRDAAFQGQRGTNRAYDESVEAGAAARCAAVQGRFWEMHDWIFANWSGENRGAFRAERLRAIADMARLDLAAYDSCLAAGTEQAAVRTETGQALALGINSTPTLLINGQRSVGAPSVEQLSAMIEGALP